MAVQTVKLDDIIMALPKSKIKAGDGINTGKYKFFTCSPIQSKYYDSFTYEGESLIMGTGGNANIHYCNEKFATSTDCLVFQKKGNLDINLKCVYYLLYGNIDLLQRGFKGCGLQHISKDYILNIEINLPERNVQDKIVDIFDHYNKVKQLKLDELTAYDNLVKSQFIEMFGTYDLRDKQTDWVKIGTVAEVVGGSTPKTEKIEYWNGEHYWITPAEIKDDSFVITDTERKLTDDGVSSCSLKLLPVGTVLLSSRAPIGKVAIAGVEMYCNQGFKNLICSEYLHPIYAYCLLKFNTEYLNSLGRGATFKEISRSIVDNIDIPLPPLDKQNEFARFVEQTDKSKILCELEVAA